MSTQLRPFFVRFILILSASLIPLFVLQLGSADATPRLKYNAQRTANEIDRLLELRMRQVFTLAAFPSIRAFAASDPATRSQRAAIALNELRAWVAADTQVRQALIVDRSGIVIMTTGEGRGEGLSARQFIREALGGHIAVSPVAHEAGEFSNYYAAPILDNQREIAGALVARIAAQELWSAVGRGDSWYAILVDENGVRLEDTGDAAQRLIPLGTLDAPRVTRITGEQTYGAQQELESSGGWTHAHELVTQGALDQLQPSDVGADALAVQPLVVKPWSVLVIQPLPTLEILATRLALPVLIAFGLALVASLALGRLS